ncbi:hypothetical protein GF337_15510 [candidate division KSB1 bacterium]|nr:hypothetical protein [candidate division KSB1 bacterium]
MLPEGLKNKTSDLSAVQNDFIWRQIARLENALSHFNSNPEHNRLNIKASLQKIHAIKKFARQYSIPAIDALSKTTGLSLKNSLHFNGKDPKPELEYYIFALKSLLSRHFDENEDMVPDRDEQFSEQVPRAGKIENGLVAIDIGHYSTKIVVSKQKKEKLSLIQWQIHEYKNQSIEPDYKEISNIISEFFEKHRYYKKLPLVTSLIDNNHLIRYKVLPQMSDRNFIRTTELEIQSELFFEDQKSKLYTYPYPANAGQKAKNKSGIVLAIDEDLIKQTIGLFKKSGYKIDQLSTDILALAQFVDQELEGSAAIIDIGFEKIKIVILDNHKICFARTIESYEYKLIHEISALEQISFDDAETIKKEFDFLKKSEGQSKEIFQQLRGESGTPQNITFQHLHKIADEIHLSLQFYNSEYDNAVNKIYLCGGGALFPGIDSFLSLALEMSVSMLNVMQNIETDYSTKNYQQAAPLLATAVGLCKLYHQPAENLKVDLRKKIDVQRNNKLRVLTVGIVSVALLCLTFLGLRTFFQHEASKLQNSIDQKKQSISETKLKISDLEQYTILKDDIDSQIQKIKSLKYSQPQWSIVLKEVSKAMPHDIWLTQLNGTFKLPQEETDDSANNRDAESDTESEDTSMFSRVTFLGKTSQPNQIQEFIFNMERNSNLKYINFNKITSRQTENVNITNFQIDGRIQISGLTNK